jgi:type IV pilus assembly protein PilM
MILGRSDIGGSPKIDVLLVAAKKDLVGEHMDLLRGADLQPMIVDVDSFAFLNCFEANYMPAANEVVALLNIGAEITSISIYIGGVSRFSRDIGIAGDTITAGIQQRLNCTFQRAEELKIREGAPLPRSEDVDADFDAESSLLDTIRGTVERITGEDLAEDSPEFVASNVIKATLGNLTNEIRRSMQFFENQPNGKAIQRIAIGGGTANLKNIDQYLSRELGLPVEIIDPMRNVAAAGDTDPQKLDRARNLLGVSIGLGLRVFE